MGIYCFEKKKHRKIESGRKQDEKQPFVSPHSSSPNIESLSNEKENILPDNGTAIKEQSINKSSLEYNTPSRHISLLMEQQNWTGALDYCKKLLESEPSPGRQAQLWQIKVKASDFYLQKCMKRYRVFEASQLNKYQKQLINDPDFKMALSCAVPEQVAYINKIVFNNEKGWNK